MPILVFVSIGLLPMTFLSFSNASMVRSQNLGLASDPTPSYLFSDPIMGCRSCQAIRENLRESM